MNLFMNMLISVYQRCYQRSFLGNFSRKWALWYTIRTMFLPSQITSRQLKLFLYKILLSNFANPYAVLVLHLFDLFLFFCKWYYDFAKITLMVELVGIKKHKFFIWIERMNFERTPNTDILILMTVDNQLQTRWLRLKLSLYNGQLHWNASVNRRDIITCHWVLDLLLLPDESLLVLSQLPYYNNSMSTRTTTYWN